jgi:uncharacterized membrane protein (UPF0182 family)
VARELNLLEQTNTKVERGNLLTLPLAGGLLYVQPVYVRSSGGGNSYPLLQKVLVGFGEKIGFANDLDSALDQVFGTSTANNPGTGTGTGQTPPTGPVSGSAALTRLQDALQKAVAALKESDTALKAGDFNAYGAAQKRLSAAVQEASDAQAALAAEAGAAPTPTPSASAKPSATPSAG